MDDARIWEMETKLWHGGDEVYRELIDEAVVMALPAEPFIFAGPNAIAAVSRTPLWDAVHFSEQQVMRPQEALIVIGYRAEASRGGERYVAYCATTMRRVEHEVWRVVQHSQMVPPVAMLEG